MSVKCQCHRRQLCLRDICEWLKSVAAVLEGAWSREASAPNTTGLMEHQWVGLKFVETIYNQIWFVHRELTEPKGHGHEAVHVHMFRQGDSRLLVICDHYICKPRKVADWVDQSWHGPLCHWPVKSSHWLVMTQGLSSSSQPSQWPVMTDFRFYRCMYRTHMKWHTGALNIPAPVGSCNGANIVFSEQGHLTLVQESLPLILAYIAFI